jgi:predicted amidohydrolase YtcJ
VVIDRDLFQIPPEEIRSAKVLTTVSAASCRAGRRG